MDESPRRGRKRPFSTLTEQCAAEKQSDPATKSSPLPQGYKSPSSIKMPMPLHHPTAGLLRAQSPLVGQHVLSFSARFIPASTPLAHALGSPIPHSYGSMVTLDPASLSPVPDPVAVAEIKRLVHQVFEPTEYNDVGEMVEALTADSSSTIATPNHVKEPTPESNQVLDGPFDEYTAEIAGAEFDVFLSQMAVQDLLDFPMEDEHVDSATQ